MPAPIHIPEELLSLYNMNGKVEIIYQYDNQADPECQLALMKNFTVENLNTSMQRITRGEVNYYGETDLWLYQALNQFPIKGKKVLLIGTTYPWYEAVCLSYGCTNVIVCEYADRSPIHEHIQYIKPDELESYKPFDAIISISSYEHDGLGRYGDPLNPNGDLKAMKDAKDLVKKDGLLYLAVPVGVDTIYFNCHRIYGEHRLPLLLENWEQIGSFGHNFSLMHIKGPGYHQPLFVLKNI
jgi:hypothetical protein